MARADPRTGEEVLRAPAVLRFAVIALMIVAILLGTAASEVFRPAVRRANRPGPDPVLPPSLKFHALRHTYASLCVAAGIPPLHFSRFVGLAKVTTTLAIYTLLEPWSR